MGVLELSMLRQFLGEHQRKLPHTVVAAKHSTIDEDHDVLGDVASEVFVEDAVEGFTDPLVRDVEVIVEHLSCRSTAQVVHEQPPFWLTTIVVGSRPLIKNGHSTPLQQVSLGGRVLGTGAVPPAVTLRIPDVRVHVVKAVAVRAHPTKPRTLISTPAGAVDATVDAWFGPA
jgi:hypothetical protein